jgi:hypothetical protein
MRFSIMVIEISLSIALEISFEVVVFPFKTPHLEPIYGSYELTKL